MLYHSQRLERGYGIVNRNVYQVSGAKTLFTETEAFQIYSSFNSPMKITLKIAKKAAFAKPAFRFLWKGSLNLKKKKYQFQDTKC